MFSRWNHPDIGSWRQDPVDLTDISRQAGFNELSFYNYAKTDTKAPSDTFLRLSCQIQGQHGLDLSKQHITYVWCLLRARHPMLDCHITQHPLTFHWICNDNLARAQSSLLYLPMFSSWPEERNNITNCSRIINDSSLSQLRVYHDTDSVILELVLVCSHAISDALSLTTCMRDFLEILTTKSSLRSYEKSIDNVIQRLPIALEGSLPIRERCASTLWRDAIMHTISTIRATKQTGSVPGFSWRERHPESRQDMHEFSTAMTKSMIEACKREGCTIGHLIYSASSAAFSDILNIPEGSSLAIGTPANARRSCREPYRSKTDEVVVNLAFLDVRLPAIRLRNRSTKELDRLWTAARISRRQVHRQVLDPDLALWSYLFMERRCKNLEDGLQNIREPSNQLGQNRMSFGSSAIGNLDQLLHLGDRRELMEITDMAIGMRVRCGEALMHSYTFHGRLRLSVMYDNQVGADIIRAWLDLTSELMESLVNSRIRSSM